MSDPIDTALLPCPFCGDPKTAIIEDPPPKPQWAFVKCTLCHCAGPTCGSRDMAIKRWNTRATSQADTARQEGVSLGLEMAKAEAEAEGWLPGQRYAASERDEGSMDCAERIAQAILALAPIPPHVAAARVLLDVMDAAVWRSAIAAMEPILRADIQPTAWNSEDEIMSALTAALEQIAKDGE